MIDILVYDTLKNGDDSNRIGGLIGLYLIAAFFVYTSLVMRSALRKGIPLTASGSGRTAIVRNFTGRYALPLIAVIAVACIAATYPVVTIYMHDMRRLEQGQYATVTGPVEAYSTMKVTPLSDRRGLSQIAGFQQSFREEDKLVVAGLAFVIKCERTPDVPVGIVDAPGKCLPLSPDSTAHVDYVQVSPTAYRTSPLRVWLLR